jgi:hypothetical protein
MAVPRILPRVRSPFEGQLLLSRRILNGRRRDRLLATRSELLTAASARSSGREPISRLSRNAIPRPAPFGAAWRTEK